MYYLASGSGLVNKGQTMVRLVAVRLIGPRKDSDNIPENVGSVKVEFCVWDRSLGLEAGS